MSNKKDNNIVNFENLKEDKNLIFPFKNIETLIINLNKCNKHYKFQEYKHQLKNLETIILTSSNPLSINENDFSFEGFTAKKIIVDETIEDIEHSYILKSFPNVKEIIFSDNIKSVEYFIKDFKTLETISIPFDIYYFEYYSFLSNSLNKLIVRDKNSICEIDVYNKDFLVTKEKGCLKIKTKNSSEKIEYKVYINENDLLEINEKYIQYAVTEKDLDGNTIDTVKLKKAYNTLDLNHILNCKEIIIGIDYQNYIIFPQRLLDFYPNLKNIKIIEDNDMSLFKKEANIKISDDEKFNSIGNINENMLFFLIENNITHQQRFIILNKNFKILDSDKIETLYLDKSIDNYKVNDNKLVVKSIRDDIISGNYYGINFNDKRINMLRNLKQIIIMKNSCDNTFTLSDNSTVKEISIPINMSNSKECIEFNNYTNLEKITLYYEDQSYEIHTNHPDEIRVEQIQTPTDTDISKHIAIDIFIEYPNMTEGYICYISNENELCCMGPGILEKEIKEEHIYQKRYRSNSLPGPKY